MHRMTEEAPPDGGISTYDDMTPILVVKFKSTNIALFFDNPVKTSSGITSTELAPLSRNSPAEINSGISAGVNADLSEFVPMPLPSNPTSLNVPATYSMGALQAIDLMVANDGVSKLYSDASGTHAYGDITVEGIIINTNIQDPLNLKAPSI